MTIVASAALVRQTLSMESARLRLAHPYPADWPINRSLDRVGELSEWIVSLEIFPAGELGRGGELIAQLHKGPLQFGLIPASLLANVDAVFETLNLPCLFRDFDHWSRFPGSEAEQLVAKLLDQQGLGLIGTTWIGSDHFITRSPIKQPVDLKGLRLRVPSLQGPAESGYEELGISPVLLPLGETRIALEKGIVDGVVGVMPWSIDFGIVDPDFAIQELPLGGNVAWLIQSPEVYYQFGEKELEIARSSINTALREAAEETQGMALDSLRVAAEKGVAVSTFDPDRWQRSRERMLVRMVDMLPPEGTDIAKLVRDLE